MFKYKFTYIYMFLLAVVLTVQDSVFVVREGTQALVTQWGEIVRAPITIAGIHFKLPFIQHLERLDLRLIPWEGTSEQIPTGDQRYVSVRAIAQWRIADFSTFIQSAQTVPHARARLDSVINGKVRDVISSHSFIDAVRSNNKMLSQDAVVNDVLRVDAIKQVMEDQHEVVTVLETVQSGRSRLEEMMLVRASVEARKLGIELLTLNIKQLNYQDHVKPSVYERMITERLQIAEKIKAVGRSEEARIRGRMKKDYQAILGPAIRRSEEIRGEVDAEVVRIYAEAIKDEHEFYRFLRTMDAYKEAFAKNRGEFIVSSQSRFFRMLKDD